MQIGRCLPSHQPSQQPTKYSQTEITNEFLARKTHIVQVYEEKICLIKLSYSRQKGHNASQVPQKY